MIMKEKRIILRVSADAKRTIEDVARLSNVSVSSYILSVVLKQAKIDLDQNETITLTNIERDSLIKVLECSPKPNQELRRLMN